MATAFKDQARRLIDHVPDTADCDDLMHQALVCNEIEAALADSAAGRVTPAEDVLREFSLSEWRSSGPIAPERG